MSFSDEETFIDNTIQENKQIFDIYYMDDIVDLMFDIKQHFSNMPYFLYYLDTNTLIDFFILCDVNKQSLTTFDYLIPNDNNCYNLFCKEFKNEIYFTHNIINTFLKRIKYKCDYRMWSLLCYKYSDLLCLLIL